jgi:hypothetical protein
MENRMQEIGNEDCTFERLVKRQKTTEEAHKQDIHLREWVTSSVQLSTEDIAEIMDICLQKVGMFNVAIKLMHSRKGKEAQK